MMTVAQAKLEALGRASRQLDRAIRATSYTDAQLDRIVSETTAEIEATKAVRPTGSL